VCDSFVAISENSIDAQRREARKEKPQKTIARWKNGTLDEQIVVGLKKTREGTE